MARNFTKSFVGIAFLLLVTGGLLVACGGDNGSTTTTSSSNSSTSSAGPRNANRGNVSGTISQYNISTKVLTVKKSDGTTTTFSTTNARIVKSQKITMQDLSSLLGTSGMRVTITGKQSSDGTYTAQNLVISDVTVRGNGNPPAGAAGTPPAGAPKGMPPTGAPGGTPRANGRYRLMLQQAKLQNDQLTGTDQTGKSVTVKLSNTTVMYKETLGTTSDLQNGQNVVINLRGPGARNTASSTGTTQAGMITVGDSTQQPGN